MKNELRTGMLTDREAEALAAIYTHRVSGTNHLRDWLRPTGSTGRYLTYCLDSLRERGLVINPGQRGRRELLWSVTPAGAVVAEGSQLVVPRNWRLDPNKNFDPAHTLAINDACTVLLNAMRSRGDEMTPLDWNHEVPHHFIRNGKKEQLFTDAVLRATRTEADGLRHDRVLLLELDRATMNITRLVDEMRDYAHYYREGRAHWRVTYGQFPDLLVVLDNARVDAATLNRRAEDLAWIINGTEELRDTFKYIKAFVTTLAGMRSGTRAIPLTTPQPAPAAPPPPPAPAPEWR